MSCDRYWELLSAQMDGALTPEEAEELEAHLSACPDCRAEQSRLAAIQTAFDELEEEEAPEGFAQSVMERVRAEEKKVIPLFQRPQFRALAGLAACAVLTVGLYGAVQQQAKDKDAVANSTMLRSFDRNALVEDEALDDPEAPMTADYTASGEAEGIPDCYDGSKLADGEAAEPGNAAPGYSMERGAELVLTLERLPEGAEELILNSEAASAVEVARDGAICFHCVTLEELEQVERMAQEQDITASRGSEMKASGRYVIVVLDGLG